MIFVTSDWHFNHNREFIYKPRGFNSVQEMNEAIVKRHNEVVGVNDIVYCLGDCCLGGVGSLEKNKKLIESLNGELHIIVGNHCTARRIEMYNTCQNVVEVAVAKIIKWNGYHFYLSHYPTMTGNLEKESLKQTMINLYGHTHQATNFYNDIPFMYHVGVDSHDCYPVCIEEVFTDIKEKVKECIDEL